MPVAERGEEAMLTGRDTLDTTTTRETTDGGLGDTLDVVTQDLPVALCTTLAEALATFAACEAVSARRCGWGGEEEGGDVLTSSHVDG